MTHRNARLTVYGRHLIVQRLEQGYTQAAAAAAASVSRSTVAKWAKRYQTEGGRRPPGPPEPAHALPTCAARARRRCDRPPPGRARLRASSHCLAARPPASTVYGVLRRAGLSVHVDAPAEAVATLELEASHLSTQHKAVP